VARWVPFLALTTVVLLLLLGLARLSQGVVDDPPQLPPGSGDDGDPSDDPGDSSAHSVAEPEETAPTGEGSVTASDDRPSTATDGARARAPPADRATAGRSGDRSTTHRPASQPEFTTGALLANVALTQGLLGAIVLGGALYYEIPAAAFGIRTGPWSVGLPALALGVAFGFVLWSANEASASIADAAGAAYDEQLREMLTPDAPFGWVVLLGLILPIIAIVEEFLFRAAIVGVPAAGFGISPWLLAVLSSVAFAFGHGAQGRVGIVVTGLLGFVLAGGFILSGSLLVVVVAHYLVNALEFLVHGWLDVDRLFR
jgi:membrane protease YdiL (CAAX protease family)